MSHAAFDIDAQGVPDPLGVLGHFDAVIWELGDNRLTQDPEDEITQTHAGRFRDLAVAEREQYLTLAVRDYLNEGGKLVHAGETAGYYGLLGDSVGGIYYGLDGAPEEDCVITEDFFGDCLLLANDFSQYYLGAYARTPFSGLAGVSGTATPLEGAAATFGGPTVGGQPDRRGGGIRPHLRRAAPRAVPAVRRRAVEHLRGGRRRQPVRPRSRASGTRRPSTRTSRTCGWPARST